MARWGEGDPRWIVEERPDATNVNNWHWTEKNATPWSKERLQHLFQDLKIEQSGIVCKVDELNKCTGEATVNNRKGKLIFFYEWELILKWTGSLPASAPGGGGGGSGEPPAEHKGKVTIPNLSEENGLDEVEITVTIEESNDASETLKQFMYNCGRERIRQVLGVYIKELKEEYSKNLILPKKGEEGVSGGVGGGAPLPTASVGVRSPAADNAVNAANAKAATTKTTAATSNSSSSSSSSVGCKLDVTNLDMTHEFVCSANDLFNALTRSDMLTAFTRAPAKADATRGGEFVLYGGNVHGKFLELVPEKRIVQLWRLRSWPSGHFSTVTITLEETANCTVMNLKQTGIPTSESTAMHNNWQRYYWQSIRQTFAFGSQISDVL